MIYTDGIHIVADSKVELHYFALKNGIKRQWYEGTMKGHPHYDCPKFFQDTLKYLYEGGYIKKITSKELLVISKRMI